MPDALYYCAQENNTCVKRESCKRYINSENQCCATLFKNACNENNEYILFIENDSPAQEEGEL